MLNLEVQRAASQKGNMDGKWGKTWTNCKKLQAASKLETNRICLSPSPNLMKLVSCRKVGKLHHRPKDASSSRAGQGGTDSANLLLCAKEVSQQISNNLAELKEHTVHLHQPLIMEAIWALLHFHLPDHTQTILMPFPNQNISGRKSEEHNLAEPCGCTIKPPQHTHDPRFEQDLETHVSF